MYPTTRDRPTTSPALPDITLLFAGSALVAHAMTGTKAARASQALHYFTGGLGTALLLCSAIQPALSWFRHRHTGCMAKLSKRHPQLHMDESIALFAEPPELFDYFRDLRGITELVPAIHNIKRTGENRHRWTLIGRNDQTILWETEIVRQEDDRLIAWQSLPNSPINSRGSIWFSPLDDGRTQLRIILQFQHTGSSQSRALAATISGATSRALRTNLQTFKEKALQLFSPVRSPKQENL